MDLVVLEPKLESVPDQRYDYYILKQGSPFDSEQSVSSGIEEKFSANIRVVSRWVEGNEPEYIKYVIKHPLIEQSIKNLEDELAKTNCINNDIRRQWGKEIDARFKYERAGFFTRLKYLFTRRVK